MAVPARPPLRPAFRYLPESDRRLLEAPVARLHVLRNRVAHHEPLLAEPLPDRYTDLLHVVGYGHPQLREWLTPTTACWPRSPSVPDRNRSSPQRLAR
jgi:hypothetical protein